MWLQDTRDAGRSTSLQAKSQRAGGNESRDRAMDCPL